MRCFIVLAIYKASYRRNCVPGNNFGDEHDAPPIFIALFATDVEAEVYFVEIGMKRDRKGPKEFGAAKPKADEANVCFPRERIQHCAAWDILVQQVCINFVVQHHEIPPISRKKYCFCLRHFG
jgi:hypothetical protein